MNFVTSAHAPIRVIFSYKHPLPIKHGLEVCGMQSLREADQRVEEQRNFSVVWCACDGSEKTKGIDVVLAGVARRRRAIRLISLRTHHRNWCQS